MKLMQAIQAFYPLAGLRRLADVALAASLTLLLLSFSSRDAARAGSRLSPPHSPAGRPEGLSPTEWSEITNQIQQNYYQVQVEPITQQAYLKASNTGVLDYFSASLALSGDTVVVGSPYEDSSATGVNGNQTDNSAPDSGAVYVFTRSGTTWSQQAYLKASNTGAGDEFGYAVALSGDTLVVGARYEDSSATGVNGDQADNSAPGAGAVYVFIRSGATWSQQGYLKASNTEPGDQFGHSVALSGDTLGVGAPGEDSIATGVNVGQADNSALESGAAYVFTRSGDSWSQQAYLKASNTEDSEYGDRFGTSIALFGDTVGVGAPEEDSKATGVNGDQDNNSGFDAGAVYVFVRSDNAWSQQAYLKASNTDAADWFGYSLALSGETLAVGAPWEASKGAGVNGNQTDDSAIGAGAVYVFVRSDNAWSQQAYFKASNAASLDYFGVSVAFSAETLVVGAPGEDSKAAGVNGDQTDNSVCCTGAAYVFNRFGSAWSQRAYLKASNTGLGDNFGDTVALSGETLGVGALAEASRATGVNGDQTDNSGFRAGAAYVFLLSPPQWTFLPTIRK